MKIIKVRCNGPEQHVNERDLDKVLGRHSVFKDLEYNYGALNKADIPERIVLNCRECTIGKVIITRTMIEENL